MRHLLHFPVALAAALTAIAVPAQAQDCPTGRFYAKAGPDTAAQLVVGESGHFSYALSEGALDEEAQGKWTCAEGVLKLTTDPAPVPPRFLLKSTTTDGEAPFELHVLWPNGRGIAGVDFSLDLDGKEPIIGYTQEDGWRLRGAAGATPVAIRLLERIHGVESPAFPIPSGKGVVMTFELEPNDIGIADFRDTPASPDGKGYVLHWRGTNIPFSKDAR